jgi:hypothetical protein
MDGWSRIVKDGETGFIPSNYFVLTDELHVEPPLSISDTASPETEMQFLKQAAEAIAQIEEAFWKVENYGFALVEDEKHNLLAFHQKLYQDHWKDYKAHVNSQRKKWRKELKKKYNPFSWEMKTLCRKGVPPDLRGQVWFKISGAYKKKEKNPDMYRNLRELWFHESNEITKQIDKDIERTFPYVVTPKANTLLQR